MNSERPLLSVIFMLLAVLAGASGNPWFFGIVFCIGTINSVSILYAKRPVENKTITPDQIVRELEMGELDWVLVLLSKSLDGKICTLHEPTKKLTMRYKIAGDLENIIVECGGVWIGMEFLYGTLVSLNTDGSWRTHNFKFEPRMWAYETRIAAINKIKEVKT